jgi:hypothetical protein
MRQLSLVVRVTALCTMGLWPSAWGQVPMHPPGTICLTPQFWCWAPVPGLPGNPCACPTPYGWVPGVLG